MSTYRVTCKEKHSLFERILAIGCVNVATGSTHRFLEDDAIVRIESGADSFFVEDSRGNRAIVEVSAREGRKFLTTVRDGIREDNLTFLLACPAKRQDGSGIVRTVTAAATHGDSPYWGA